MVWVLFGRRWACYREASQLRSCCWPDTDSLAHKVHRSITRNLILPLASMSLYLRLTDGIQIPLFPNGE
uniref:Uncharacterized protein n=1 Tax=Rhizophora mucronata TaxID=61149 RepID=A0A2P2IWK4_RHIMU